MRAIPTVGRFLLYTGLLCLAFVDLFSQAIQVVSVIKLSAYEGRSYLFTREVRLQTGFSVSAQIAPGFFCRYERIVNQPVSLDRNFVRTELVDKKGVLFDKDISTLQAGEKQTLYSYSDGLGNRTQDVTAGSSPSRADWVEFFIRDDFGRMPTAYLPFTAGENMGSFITDPVADQKSFYDGSSSAHPYGVVADRAPFKSTVFDNSPLNQSRKVYNAGFDWHPGGANRSVNTTTFVNRTDEVRRWRYSATGPPQVNGYYAQNTLLVSEVVDEENLIQRTYKDFKDQVVLERKGDGATWFDTYYIYDLCGKIAFVLPPEASKKIFQSNSPYIDRPQQSQQAFIDTLCFQFKYDAYSRLTDKRIPGSGWIYTIYDSWDRVVLTQDAVQRINSQWTFTKYDIFNRPVLTGFTTGSRTLLRNSAGNSTRRYESNSNTSTGYTNITFPIYKESDLLSVMHYDNYNFLTSAGWDTDGISFDFKSEAGIGATYFSKVKGYTTGTKVRVLGSSRWLNTVNYYDDQYRVVQVIQENHLGGFDRTSTLYNFNDTKSASVETHSSPSGSASVRREYAYDHAKRLLQVSHQINGGAKVLMLSNTYNELGQVIEENIHSLDDGQTFLQSVDNRYTIRGWKRSVNNSRLVNDGTLNNDINDLFGMEIQYNDEPLKLAQGNNQFFTTRKLFNGNISAIKWKIDTRQEGEVPQEKIYGFSYDPFNRFTGSYYATRISGTWSGSPALYNENVTRYDANGNIGGQTGVSNPAALSRIGMSNGAKALIDNLVYRYSGNQLRNITDISGSESGFSDKPGIPSSATEYRFDENGNMTEDGNKDIGLITYNHLNMPTSIEFRRATLQVDRIEFTYDAFGNKLSRVIKLNGTPFNSGTQVWRTDFVGPIQYDNGKISSIQTDEGRAVFNGTGYDYEYFLRDHQDNVRVVYGALKETLSYKATMETSLASIEEDPGKGFKNIAARRINPGNSSFNFTLPSERIKTPDRSAKCNANIGHAVGPAKSLRILAGDAVYMEVYAKYIQPLQSGHPAVGAALLGSLVNLAFGLSASTDAMLFNEISSKAALAAGSVSSGSVLPKAYIAFLFFDDNYVFQRSGVMGITIQAYNSFEKLTRSFTAEKNGYLYVYVASESNVSAADVFFDDFYIIHQKNNTKLQVTQASDYYPFGLAFNEYNADRIKLTGTSPDVGYEPVLRNRRRFQGQYHEKDLNLGWYHYKYRMHDPVIGRFIGVDPLAEQFYGNSVYAFSENKLIDAVELEGLEASRAIYEVVKYISPVSVKLDLHQGSHRQGIGFEVSIGIPKAFPFSHRRSFGTTFFTYDAIQAKSVVEKRVANETSYFGLVSMQSTHYQSGPTSQTTGMITLGNPLINMRYENDWFPAGVSSLLDPMGIHPKNFGDGGDRYRTAAFQMNLGIFNAGFNLATGDPGLGERDRMITFGKGFGKNGSYVKNSFGNDPDEHRLGIGYFGVGDLKFGLNNEYIRNFIQNDLAHDWLTGSPHFMMLPRSNQIFIEYSTGTGTQW